MRHLTSFLFTAVLACASASAAAQIPVARVNGTVILSDALDRGFDNELRARNLNIARMQRPEQVRDIKREVLDRLIRDELLWQKARKDGMVVSDAEVERSLAETKARFESPQAFARGIARDGYDEHSFRDYVRRMLSADRAAQALVAGNVVVTDEDVERFYRDNPTYFHRPEQVRVHEILIAAPADADAAARAQARARIEELRGQIAAGADFEDIARQYSEHPTRQWGGEHDPVVRGQLAPSLEEAAFTMKPGELSAVLETQAGFHLLRLDERLPAVTVPLAQASDQIRQYLTQQRGREVLDREVAALRAQNKVEILLPL